MIIYIEDTAGNRYECDVAIDTMIGTIAADFFDQLGWSKTNSQGSKTRAVVELVVKRGVGVFNKNKRLKADQTIAELGIEEGSILRIFPEAVAGCFTGDTLISINVSEARPISEIKVGDKVLSGIEGSTELQLEPVKI